MSHRSPHRRRLLAWGGRLLLVAGLLVLLHRFDDGSVPRHPLFHPEAIYPAALYADLANWSTWGTPYAPYFVPDMPLFFLCMWAAGEPAAATYAFGALQLTLLVVAFCGLFGAVLRDAPERRLAMRWAVLAGAWLAVLFSFNVHGDKVLLQLFVAAFHTGSFVLAIFGLTILLSILNLPSGVKTRRAAGRLSLLFLLCFLGVLSDQLLLAVFVLPAILALVLHVRRFTARRRTAWIVVVLTSGAVLGLRAVAWINAADVIRIATFAELDVMRYVDSVRALWSSPDDLVHVVPNRFFEKLGWGFRTYWLLWLLTTLTLTLSCYPRLSAAAPFRGLQHLSPASRRNLGFFAVHMVLSFALTALATNYVAMVRYSTHLEHPTILFIDRYLVSLYTTPLIAVALYVPVLLGHRRAARLEIVQVAVLAILVLVQVFRLDLAHPFPSYRPPQIVCLDEKAERYDMHTGLAHFYSHARTLNLFSRRDLHADQVTRGLLRIDWIDSRSRRGERTGYDFVITNRLGEREMIVARLGPPDRELQCEDWNVFVYDEPVFPSLPEYVPRAVR